MTQFDDFSRIRETLSYIADKCILVGSAAKGDNAYRDIDIIVRKPTFDYLYKNWKESGVISEIYITHTHGKYFTIKIGCGIDIFLVDKFPPLHKKLPMVEICGVKLNALYTSKGNFYGKRYND